ncbi:MAG: hypothetical protein QGF53_10630, partial [Alphaproteobacteria bacterium]|nr:hypothetical protein [Alphaproteobacteria bacterium]
IFMNPIAKTGAIETKAEYIITVTWPEGNPSDVDTWTQDPAGNLTWYAAKEAGLMHLDRDDTGTTRDILTINGVTVENPLNQEIVSIRGVVPGEWTVNIQMYAYDPTGLEESASSNPPVPVTVKVEKINPVVRVVFYDTLILRGQGDEVTAVRFTIQQNGDVADINPLPKKLFRAT